MARIAFITDMHICRESRWEETQRIMDWCVAKCAELRPDATAFGGDLWDRKPDVHEMKVTAEWCTRLADIAPLVGVAGNHDAHGISVLNLLDAKNPIHIVEAPEVYVAAGVEFVLLPWPRKSQLLSLLGEAGKEEARQVGVDLLLNVLRGLGLQRSELVSPPRCFVGHVQLRGAKVSTGQPLAPGADFELGTEDLALAQCDAYLLGHIHLPDDMTTGGKPVSYGGSFRRTAYGEVEEKSLVLLEIDDYGVANIVRHPIPCAPMLLLEDRWLVHDDGIAGWLDGAPENLDVRGAEIRFRFRCDTDQRDAARAAAEAVKEGLLEAGAVDVRLDPIVNAVGEARAPEVALATTLADKLRAYWGARQTTPEKPREARLLGKAADLEENAHAV